MLYNSVFFNKIFFSTADSSFRAHIATWRLEKAKSVVIQSSSILVRAANAKRPKWPQRKSKGVQIYPQPNHLSKKGKKKYIPPNSDFS